ncbi:MAG: DsbA family protein [Pyrinomonadaceae bacterium]
MSPDKSSTHNRYLPFIIIGAVLAVAVVAGTMWFRSAEPAAPAAATSQTASVQPVPARRDPLPGARPPHVRGVDRAPVTLEEFGDFQCPPCAALHPEMKKIEADFGERLRVVFRHLPLPNHQYAVDAARAAEAAAKQGRFWEMHDMIFENQNAWKNGPDVRAIFTTYARNLGLNVEKFKADMDAMDVAQRIVADQQRAASLGVTGTPTVFLNGRELDFRNLTLEGLRAEIEAAGAGKKQ